MEVVQVYNLANTATNEALGTENVLLENLSNLVDVGTQIFNAEAVDRYVRSLVNQIGKIIFVSRPYRGAIPSVLMDAWEFGSVLEKITVELPEATENESWELVDRASYDPNIFYKPQVSAKFFNKKVTFEVDMSFTEMQVKQSFQNATQMNSFLSMLYTAVEKSMTIKTDALVMRTINNFIGETVYADYQGGDLTASSGIRAINLLKLYKDRYADAANLTPAQAITTPEFIRFAAYTMGNYIDRLTRISTLFNIGGKDRFTPKDMLHVVMLSDFRNAADTYLQSDTFHDAYTALPNAETVPYWQGSGTDFQFGNVSKINVTTTGNHNVEVGGVLAIMFDRDALGVSNLSRRVTTNYNAKAEFWNNFYKFDAGYFNDQNENFLVFFVA